MVDYFGKELAIGDTVAFMAPKYRMLVSGTITDFTPKQIRIAYKNTWNYGGNGSDSTFLTPPSTVIKK